MSLDDTTWDEDDQPSPRRSRVPGYTLGQPIGSGGGGSVYEATDPSGNAVALKVMHPRSAPAIRQR